MALWAPILWKPLGIVPHSPEPVKSNEDHWNNLELDPVKLIDV